MSQATYSYKILVKYTVQDSKKGFLPFKCEIPLFQDQCPNTPKKKKHMQTILYALIVGNLMYAMLHIRLNIYFVVGMVSRYSQI